MSQWYAIETAPSQERKVTFALIDRLGIPAFLPIETDWLTRGGKVDKTGYAYAPRLPGYVFVLIDEHFTDEKGRGQFRQVLELEGVNGIVDFIDMCGDSHPFPIPTAAIIEMQADERAGRYDLTNGVNLAKPKPKAYRPKKGEKIQVIAGAYMTWIGVVLATPRKNRVKVRFDDGKSPMLKVSHIAAAAA